MLAGQSKGPRGWRPSAGPGVDLLRPPLHIKGIHTGEAWERAPAWERAGGKFARPPGNAPCQHPVFSLWQPRGDVTSHGRGNKAFCTGLLQKGSHRSWEVLLTSVQTDADDGPPPLRYDGKRATRCQNPPYARSPGFEPRCQPCRGELTDFPLSPWRAR